MKEILKNHTILYAEDDKALQQITTEYLQRYFKEVYLANDGKEAITQYKSYHPHVLLLDIDMPSIDGLRVATQIRQNDPTIPIVMMTAYTDTTMLLEATELNLTTYLVKPVSSDSFKEALHKVSVKLQAQHIHKQTIAKGYVWDSMQKVLYAHGEVVQLPLKEKALLALLVKHMHHCVSFEEIMAVVWEDAFDTDISIQSIKFQVTQLRKKLPHNTIRNVYSRGYTLD